MARILRTVVRTRQISKGATMTQRGSLLTIRYRYIDRVHLECGHHIDRPFGGPVRKRMRCPHCVTT